MIINEYPVITDITRKIELLCWGLRKNRTVEDVYDRQNPFDLTRTGNVGLQLLIGSSRIVANVPVFNRFNDESPFTMLKEGEEYYIKNDITNDIFCIYPMETPNWYMQEVSKNKFAGQYLLREGTETLICSITNSCCYVPRNLQCRFCAMGSNSVKNIAESSNSRRLNIIKSIYCALADPQNSATSINLTGGNSYELDRGSKKYLEFVEAIRKKSDIEISIELSPPSDMSSLLALKEVGVNAVMMNIEIWDEKIRDIIMPGKAQIKREEYIKAWSYAVGLFGKGNVSSVIIIGLENNKSVKDAIDTMTSIGVMPSIMPFRPNDGAVLECFPTTNPHDVAYLTSYAVECAKGKDISIINTPGCIGCGACAAELDYYRE